MRGGEQGLRALPLETSVVHRVPTRSLVPLQPGFPRRSCWWGGWLEWFSIPAGGDQDGGPSGFVTSRGGDIAASLTLRPPV